MNNFIFNIIDSIVKTVFQKEPQKRDILIKSGFNSTIDYYNFACPYCLDSQKNRSKKRGYFYLNTFTYYCFNCNIFKNFREFISDFKDIIGMDDISISGLLLDVDSIVKERQLKIAEISQKRSNIFSNLQLSDIDNIALSKDFLREKFGFISISDTPGEAYLKARHQLNSSTDYEKFDYDLKNQAIVIYNLINHKILGYQLRFVFKSNPKYLTYKLSKIYQLSGLDVTDTITKCDVFSTLFNFFNLNLNKPITIFEGVFDGFLYDNSISILGINRVFNLPVIFDYYRFWLDNDEIGRNTSIELIEKNEEIFLWNYCFDDLNIEKKYRSTIKDLNDLVKHLLEKKKYSNVYSIFRNIDFSKYFSNKKIDIIYL